MQDFYMKKLSLKDIPFNFLIGGDGSVYEGRGFFNQGEMVRSDNINSFDASGLIFAFIGNFSDVRPDELQMNTFERFLIQSKGRDLISENFILLSQEQITSAHASDGLKDAIRELPGFYNRKLLIHKKKAFKKILSFQFSL